MVNYMVTLAMALYTLTACYFSNNMLGEARDALRRDHRLWTLLSHHWLKVQFLLKTSGQAH